MIAKEIDQFISHVCAGKTNETPTAYRSKLKRLDQWMTLRGVCLENLSEQLLDEFRRSLLERKEKRRGARTVKGTLSPYTIHTVLMTVRHFLKWAHQTGLIVDDLSTSLVIKQPPRPEPKAIEAEAALRLLEAASRTGEKWEQARNLAILYLLRDTAGRISSIIHADIDDLDLKARKLYVVDKGNKARNLYLSRPTLAALREWLKHRPDLNPKDTKLFLSIRGRGLARSSIYSLLTRVKEHAPPIQGRSNPHAYRHAWARDALTNGEDISKVAETLGNSVRVTAEYYARWNDRELQAAHSKFSPGKDLPVIKPKDRD